MVPVGGTYVFPQDKEGLNKPAPNVFHNLFEMHELYMSRGKNTGNLRKSQDPHKGEKAYKKRTFIAFREQYHTLVTLPMPLASWTTCL